MKRDLYTLRNVRVNRTAMVPTESGIKSLRVIGTRTA